MIYLIAGVPGSGKSWVVSQLRDKYLCLEHDTYIGEAQHVYVSDAMVLSKHSSKPILIETPFSVSKLADPIREFGIPLTIVYLVEPDAILIDRYRGREGKEPPKGHLTRNRTYLSRAEEQGAFWGGSEEVLAYLRSKV